jgi:hypothetical protein
MASLYSPIGQALSWRLSETGNTTPQVTNYSSQKVTNYSIKNVPDFSLLTERQRQPEMEEYAFRQALRLFRAKRASRYQPYDPSGWLIDTLGDQRVRDLLKAAETGGYKAFYDGYLRLRRQAGSGGVLEHLIRPENFIKLWDAYLQVKALAQKLSGARPGQPQTPGTPSPSPDPGSPGGNPPGTGRGRGTPRPGQPQQGGTFGPFVSYLLPWY